MNDDELKQEDEVRRLLNAGNKFKHVVIENSQNGYQVVFVHQGGARFSIGKQKRLDRDSGIRIFKTIDAAVSAIRRIGWTQVIAVVAV